MARFILAILFFTLFLSAKKGFHDLDEEEDYPFFLHEDEEEGKWGKPLEEYPVPEQIDKSIWEQVRPYFIPSNHPIKAWLDQTFSKGRPHTNSETLKAAGFTQTKPGKLNRMIVSSHPEVKDFLFKIVTDDQEDTVDWERWIKRIEGSRSLKQTIEQLDQTHRFTVPNKWIYPVPNPLPHKAAKNFLLVVEDVKLIDQEKNREKWKNQITKKDLEALLAIAEKEGLSDCLYPFNLPYTSKGKLAFIDTEKHHTWPVLYHRLNPYLSDQNLSHWKLITKQ